MNIYSVLADVVLGVHALFVGFVVFGLGLILIGLQRQWRWVRNFWFRFAHLLAIGGVVLQSWLGILCPLTVWENQLRLLANEPFYRESFVAYWLHKVIFYRAEPWVFTVIYTLFGACVLASWIWGKPQWPALFLKISPLPKNPPS